MITRPISRSSPMRPCTSLTCLTSPDLRYTRSTPLGKTSTTCFSTRGKKSSRLPKTTWARGVNEDRIVTVVLDGHPAEELDIYADSQDIDLIVIGTHGRKGLNRLLIGSVADKVVRGAKVPVLIVRSR